MNKTKHYFLHLLREFRAFVLLYAVVYLVVYPLTIYIRTEQLGDMSPNAYSLPVVTVLPLAWVTLLLCIVTPFIMLRYLYEKPTLDTYFSLPIDRAKFFLSRLIFGWLIIVIPMVISHILGYLILLAKDPSYLRLTGDVSYTPGVFFGQMGLLVAGSLILMMPSVISILCTTNLFNGMVYAVVLNTLPYTISMVWAMFGENFLGSTLLNPTAAVNELGWLQFQRLYLEALRTNARVDHVVPILLWAVVALGLIVLCVWLYRNHKVERTNAAYMVKGFYPVMISVFGVLLLILALGSKQTPVSFTGIFAGEQELILIFFFGFILYFLVQIIRRKGVPKILPTILGYILLFVVALGLTWALNIGLKEGRSRQLVNPAQVKRAVVVNALPGGDFDYPEKPGVVYFDPYGFTTKIQEAELTEPADIEALVSLQEDLIDHWMAKVTYNNMQQDHWQAKATVQLRYYDAQNRLIQVRKYVLQEDDQKERMEALTDLDLLVPSLYR